MADGYEAVRAKRRLFVALLVIVLVWALPYVIDTLMYKFTGHGIFTNPPDIARVNLGKATLGDAVKTLVTWFQWLVTGIAAVVIVVSAIQILTAE